MKTTTDYIVEAETEARTDIAADGGLGYGERRNYWLLQMAEAAAENGQKGIALRLRAEARRAA